MRGSETAVVPGDPGNDRNDRQDDHHQDQQKSLGGHGSGPELWIVWRFHLLGRVLVSGLPYGISQLPSKPVSVLMQIKQHHRVNMKTRVLQINS